MHTPLVRLLACLALVFAVALVTGCGNGDEDPLWVSVRCLSPDGTLPDGMQAARYAGDGAIASTHDLVPREGGRAGEYQVVGGIDGAYRLQGPEGWCMLQLRPEFLQLRRGQTPPEARMGRTHTVYVGPATQTARPGLRWGAERVLADGTRVPVSVKTEADEDGYVVLIRFPAEAWRDDLELIGHVALGHPDPKEADGPPGPLSDAIRFRASENGHAVVTQIRQATASPLDVVLVAAAEGVAVDGTEVRARILGLPIEVDYETRCERGVARFPAIAAVSRDLELRIGDDTFAFPLASWRSQANLRILRTGDLPTRTVHVIVDDEPEVLLVRPKGAVAFGRVPFETTPRDEGGSLVAFDAPKGPFHAYFRSGRRWTHVLGDEQTGTLPAQVAPSFEQGVDVRGQVAGALPGTVVRFFLQMGEEAVLGDGFTLRVTPSGAYEGNLPTGVYFVETANSNGEKRLGRPLDAQSPGTSVHLPLNAP